jgi:hypothetical protein
MQVTGRLAATIGRPELEVGIEDTSFAFPVCGSSIPHNDQWLLAVNDRQSPGIYPYTKTHASICD